MPIVNNGTYSTRLPLGHQIFIPTVLVIFTFEHFLKRFEHVQLCQTVQKVGFGIIPTHNQSLACHHQHNFETPSQSPARVTTWISSYV